MNTILVSALSACAAEARRDAARRFLQGLSGDELRYIAEFLGACIVESASSCQRSREQLAEGIAAFERCRQEPVASAASLEDREHKMILLLEYLCRCGLNQFAPALRTTR